MRIVSQHSELLDFVLWDITLMGITKCNEGIKGTTPSLKCDLGPGGGTP